jgi:hydrophobe/amphiphile efflux-1 (HAE1) family protein
VNISEPFIRRPVATTLMMAALAFVGIVSFPFLPVAPLPQVDFPTIQITTTWSGASAETMATSVAAPLELQFGQIAGVTQMTSQSSLGAATIVIQFDLERNIDSAAQDVQAAITVANKQLPQSLTTPPAYKKVNPADVPILLISVHSDSVPIINVDDYANIFLAQQIAQISGVAQVLVFGDQTPSIRVQVDPFKLAANGITLEEIRGTLVSQTTNAAKGSVNGDRMSFMIAANDQIIDADKFNNVVLAYRNGAPIRVRDVGQAVAAPVDRTVVAYQNNKEGVILAVFKQPGANVIDIVDNVKAQLPQLKARIPPAVETDIILDRTKTIRASVADVEFTLVLTVCLVVMVILLFLRNFWATLIPSVTVPLALAGSFGAMYLMHFSIDNLSLMALTIAIGFVVDDAIVVVENIYRHVEHGEAPFTAALKGSREIGFTVLSISFSLVAVFIPLLLMSGIIGRLFREFALTVTASIAVSALVSLTLAPMMCARFMRREPETHGRVYRVIENGFDAMLSFYRRTLDVVLRHQAITLAVFFGTMALTLVMAIQIPKGFFPIQDTGLIQGFAEAAQQTSPREMMRLMHNLGDVILHDRDIEAFGAQTGSTGSAQAANTGRYFLSLAPRDDRELNASQIIDRLRPQLAKVEGAALFLQPAQDINVGARIARGSFQYTLQDTNIDELNEWSQKLLEKLKTAPFVPLLADVTSDLLANAPRLQITINRDQASRFGISPQAIDDTLNDAFGQRQITQYFTQLKTYFLVLEILPELQKDLSTLDRLYVKSPLTGGAVPLSALVDIDSNQVGPLLISHQGQFPAVTITFNLVPGISLGQAVAAVNEASREINMPAAIIPTFQGNAQAFQTSLKSEPALIAAALIVVYIILGVLYESFIHPLTILSTIPSAGVGALLALNLGHMDLSVIGIIGIILLIGIVKKNGIMMVDFAITAERDEHMSPAEAIRQACLLRFRPIMMTTAAAMLAGIPLALGNGAGSEMRQPLGYAMVGGLALSQVLTLYTTPVVYLYLDRLQTWLFGEKRGPIKEETEPVHAVAAE